MNLDSVETGRNDAFKDSRRIDSERRQFSYTHHIPERRTGNDRRSQNDRRKEPRIKGSVDVIPDE
jgi:hypothetical protein